MDPNNFQDEKMAENNEVLINMLFNLHKNLVYQKTETELVEEKMRQEEIDKQLEENERFDRENCAANDELTEFEKMLYEDMLKDDDAPGNNKKSVLHDDNYYENKKIALKKNIETELKIIYIIVRK